MNREIRAVKLVDGCYEPCEEDDPEAVWGLYETVEDGIVMHVKDYKSKTEAEAARDAA